MTIARLNESRLDRLKGPHSYNYTWTHVVWYSNEFIDYVSHCKNIDSKHNFNIIWAKNQNFTQAELHKHRFEFKWCVTIGSHKRICRTILKSFDWWTLHCVRKNVFYREGAKKMIVGDDDDNDDDSDNDDGYSVDDNHDDNKVKDELLTVTVHNNDDDDQAYTANTTTTTTTTTTPSTTTTIIRWWLHRRERWFNNKDVRRRRWRWFDDYDDYGGDYGYDDNDGDDDDDDDGAQYEPTWINYWPSHYSSTLKKFQYKRRL